MDKHTIPVECCCKADSSECPLCPDHHQEGIQDYSDICDAHERIRAALSIVNSEALMWIIAGPNHLDAHRATLRPTYLHLRNKGGGYNPTK